MSKILDEMLGKGATTISEADIILILAEFNERISELEKEREYGGVYVDGSTKVVKDYYKKHFDTNREGD